MAKSKRAKTTQILRQTTHTFAANLDNGQMRLGILSNVCVDDCCPRRANDLTGGLNTVQLAKVFAAAVTTHNCGAKCRNATGPACECSCKGEHHGEG